MNNLARFLKAATFAAKKHMRQKRKGANGEPYINHPLEVAELLVNVGKVKDYDILIAAVLHDTLEDTNTVRKEIVHHFGERVCGFVEEVTDDKSLPKAKRKELQIKHAPRLSYEAKYIKLADKISNINDIINNPPENWSVGDCLEYIDWGEKVVQGVRGTNPDLETLFDSLVKKARAALIKG